MQKAVLYSLFSLVVMSTTCYAQRRSQRPVLKWEENFDQTNAFDTARWSKIPRGRADWQKYMSDFDSCYAMRDGKMILRGIINNSLPNDTARYLTGGIYTKDKVSFGFGRLEIHAKLNGARGAWPAFWLLSQGMGWPDGGEVDIMERLNFDSIAYQTVHSHYTYTLKIKEPKQGATGPINPLDFNTYAVELHRDSLVFFINSKRTFAYPRIQTAKEGQYPFDKYKYYLLLDMQLGGNWVGKVDPADLPVEMEIDWVRFYEFKE
ncbi:MAG: beta-glucanase [Sphingobacteriales bacterium 40-81]|nr:MAG: beta-glucanase [Sphingobacteriales bacterium 40-81]